MGASTVGVEHLCFEHHFGRHLWEIVGESEAGFVEPTFEGGVLRALEAQSPSEEILVDQPD